MNRSLQVGDAGHNWNFCCARTGDCLPPFVEQTQETVDVTPQRSQFAPNTSSTSTSQHDFTSSSSTSTGNDRLDALARMLDSCIEQLTELETIETLTKQLLEPPLPDPPIVEPSVAESPGLTSAKRRRRPRYTPLPGSWNTQCTWLQVLGRRYGTLYFKRARDVHELERH